MDDREIAAAVYAKLAERVGADRYETWFANGSRIGFAEGRLIVSAPNTYLQDWQRKLFRKELAALGAEVCGHPTEVVFTVDASLAAPGVEPAVGPENAAARRHLSIDTDDEESSRVENATPEDSSSPVSIPIISIASRQRGRENGQGETSPRQCAPAAPRKPAKSAGEPTATTNGKRSLLTFEQYVVGPCNEMATHSAQLVLDQPGRMCPLTLYGRPGLGKSHLLEALQVAARQRKRHVLHLTAEQFTSHFFEACQGKGVPSFRQKYRGVELLLIDDIHFFGRTRQTLVELLYTVESLQKAGQQLVFTADRSPRQLTELGPELVNRLVAGLHCELQLPDYATRRKIVEQLCQRMRLHLPPGVDAHLALHISGTARELSGAINRLDATSRALGKPLTMELAEETIANLASQGCRVLQLRDIENVVCDLFGVTVESLHSNRRGEDVQHPRMLAMFLARKHTRAALGEISRYFGRRSHSTAITANRTVANWMDERRHLKLARQSCEVEQTIREIEQRLLAI